MNKKLKTNNFLSKKCYNAILNIKNFAMKKYLLLLLILFITLYNSILCESSLKLEKRVYTKSELDSLVALLKGANDNKKIDILIELTYGNLLNKSVALKYFKEGYDLATKNSDEQKKAQLLLEKGKTFDKNKEHSKGIEQFIAALKIFKKLEDKKGIGTSYNFIGQAYYNKNDQVKAVEYYLYSLDILRSIDDKEGIAICANDLGIVNYFLGNYDVSLKYYIEALSIKEKLNKINSLAISYNNISLVYFALKNYDESLKFLFKASELNSNIKDFDGISAILSNIANIYVEKGNTQLAYEFSLKAIQESRTRNNNVILANSYYNLGKLFLYNDEYITSKKYLKLALAIYDSLNSPQGISQALNRLAKVSMLENNYKDAVVFLEQSLAIAKKHHFRERIKECFIDLSTCFKQFGDYKQSLDYLNEYISISDSLMNNDKNRQLLALQIAYETEKKSKEIELLKSEQENDKTVRIALIIIIIFIIFFVFVLFYSYTRKKIANKVLSEKNEKINLQKEELQEANLTKDKFFSIIAHDLKSPFQGILGFSNYLIDNLDTLSKVDIKSYIKLLNEQVQGLYGLIENLLDWSRVQNKGMKINFENIKIATLVNDVVKVFDNQARKKNIKITINASEEYFVLADKNMLFSIFQNLISNSLKFTHIDGYINIYAKSTIGNKIEVTIEDDGVGISDENKEKLFKNETLFSNRGTADEKGTGLGLIITKEFVEKNNGTIRIESEENKGTKFIICFPSI